MPNLRKQFEAQLAKYRIISQPTQPLDDKIFNLIGDITENLQAQIDLQNKEAQRIAAMMRMAEDSYQEAERENKI